VRYLEQPEVESILEELEEKYKLDGQVYIAHYDKKNPNALELEHLIDDFAVDPKVSWKLRSELIFRIFTRMSIRK